jgi:predicted PurR-regulated permease PerM
VSQFQVFYRDINEFLQGGSSAYDMFVQLFDSINSVLARIPYFEYRLSVDNMKVIIQQNIAPVANFVLGYSVDIGVSFAKSIPLIIVFLYLLWYGFPEHDRFITFIKKVSPLSDKLDNLYLSRVTAMIVGIAKGTVVIAIIQGIIAGLSLLIGGVPYVFFWTMVMIFFSIIPLGAGLITIPAALVMLATGNVWQSIFIFFVQFVVTSNIDNVLKPMLIPKEAEVHPVLILLSIIGGIQVFGVWGFIYGPLVMVIFLTTVEVYQKYYKIAG